MELELQRLKEKVNKYHEVLENTNHYRQQWKDGLKKMIKDEDESPLTEESSYDH